MNDDVIWNSGAPKVRKLPRQPGSRLSKLAAHQIEAIRRQVRRQCRSGGGCISHNYATGECNSVVIGDAS